MSTPDAVEPPEQRIALPPPEFIVRHAKLCLCTEPCRSCSEPHPGWLDDEGWDPYPHPPYKSGFRPHREEYDGLLRCGWCDGDLWVWDESEPAPLTDQSPERAGWIARDEVLATIDDLRNVWGINASPTEQAIYDTLTSLRAALESEALWVWDESEPAPLTDQSPERAGWVRASEADAEAAEMYEGGFADGQATKALCKCGRGHLSGATPRWADDPIVQHNGWLEGCCPDCGAPETTEWVRRERVVALIDEAYERCAEVERVTREWSNPLGVLATLANAVRALESEAP